MYMALDCVWHNFCNVHNIDQDQFAGIKELMLICRFRLQKYQVFCWTSEQRTLDTTTVDPPVCQPQLTIRHAGEVDSDQMFETQIPRPKR